MLRRVALLGGVLLALTAAPAYAGSGGLYEPYPTPVSNSLTLVYYGSLGVTRTEAQLTRGVFSPGLAASTSTAASRRAGVDPGSAGFGPLVAVLAAALALAALAQRRRPLSSLR